VITNEVQYRATKAHLRQFEEAADNLEAKTGAGDQSQLTQLELEAVKAQQTRSATRSTSTNSSVPGRCRRSRPRRWRNWQRCS
jgi:hypothetical protein